MTFRRSAPVALILAVVVIVAGAALVTSRLFAGMTDAVEADQFRTMQAIVETAIRDAENKALARAELISDLPVVRKLFAAGDRTGLNAELSKMFAGQKARHGVDQAQFHLASLVSFLRLHDPAAFGDDLTRFRPLVVAANREQVPMKGAAVARNGPAIFGVAPVLDPAGKHIGTFEIGIDYGPLLAALKTAYGIDLALYIDEALLKEFAAGVDPERLGDQNRVGKYIRFEATNAQLMTELARPEDLAVVNEPLRYVRAAQGLARGVVLLPINSASGTPLGVIAASQDFSASRAAVSRSLIWQGVVTLIAIILLAGFILVVLRGFLLRPLAVLGERFEAVGAGTPLTPITGTEKFPAEMQPLVTLYDRIRSRRTEPEKA
ncbi:cache domain-containing protein [Sinorhizobium sp. RAC02]|uniref:cache domain-containing protein n=1 Tax=Sinorhizobium sp. RAC02 TaxID=1842534 RepID=UPI00083CC6F5|nr:cache domain-containing protein [Sinorhizobium sp. RAC02]AOF92045.1 putative methyl-accepting chemotaxis protein [Sinorhizobium sp. RAC02]